MKLDFLIIGSQRCATTYLHDVFEADNSINVPNSKETNYFSNGIYKQDLASYFKKFSSENGLVGEACPSYFLMRPAEIRHLKQMFPYLKIVLVLRDPVKRMHWSIQRHWTFSYLPDTAEVGTDFKSLLRFVFKPTNIYFGKYDYTLKKWEKEFSKEQILVLFYDDLKENSTKFMHEIYNFLGCRTTNLPKEKKHSNVSKVKGEIDERVSYLIYKLHERELRRMVKRGLNRPQEWIDKYEDRFKIIKIPLSIKILANLGKFISQNIYNPLNKLTNIQRAYKLKQIKYLN